MQRGAVTENQIGAVGGILSRWRLMGSELHLLKVETRESGTVPYTISWKSDFSYELGWRRTDGSLIVGPDGFFPSSASPSPVPIYCSSIVFNR